MISLEIPDQYSSSSNYAWPGSGPRLTHPPLTSYSLRVESPQIGRILNKVLTGRPEYGPVNWIK